MSRRMTAPGVWTEEPPGTVRLHQRTYASVPCVVVGMMKPIVTPGGNSVDWKSTYRLPALTVKP